MHAPDFVVVIEESIAGRRLLDHPYYQRWQDGLLGTEDLAAYAHQYRYFEQDLPTALAGVAGEVPDGAARRLVLDNLDDELSRPARHADLFEEFASAVGASGTQPATPATADLVGLYRTATEAGPVAALSVIGAYEAQAAEIAATKEAALHEHHGLRPEATKFWNVHSQIERDHAAWTAGALAELGADQDEVRLWASRSADAWWAFLDERESELQAAG